MQGFQTFVPDMPLAFYQNILPKKKTLLSVNVVDFANIFDSCFLFDLID